MGSFTSKGLLNVIRKKDIETFKKNYDLFEFKEDFSYDTSYSISSKEKHEITCIMCSYQDNKEIFKYVCENYKVDYDNLFKHLLMLSYPNRKRFNRETFDIIIDNIKEIKAEKENIYFLLKQGLHNDKVKDFLINYQDKDVFNEILRVECLTEEIIRFCLLFATDEELIDHALLLLNDDFLLKLNDINREFRANCLFNKSFFLNLNLNIKYINDINKYGFLILNLDISSSNNSKTIQDLVNRGAILKVVEMDIKDFEKIDISLLKYIKDVENFDDFIHLNRCFLMKSVKNNEEADYLLSVL